MVVVPIAFWEVLALAMVRIFFTKKGRAKYISHLDLTRCMSRFLARTDIPIWYTEGFNPHIYMTFALPLPLGVEGLRESMDIKLTDESYPLDKIPKILSPMLPMGMEILEAALPVDRPEAIALAEYRICLHHPQPDYLKEQLEDFLAKDTMIVTKKTKKGNVQVDIRPHIQVLSMTVVEGCSQILLRTDAGPSFNVNPALVLGAYEAAGGTAPEYVQVARTAILREDLTLFT